MQVSSRSLTLAGANPASHMTQEEREEQLRLQPRVLVQNTQRLKQTDKPVLSLKANRQLTLRIRQRSLLPRRADAADADPQGITAALHQIATAEPARTRSRQHLRKTSKRHPTLSEARNKEIADTVSQSEISLPEVDLPTVGDYVAAFAFVDPSSSVHADNEANTSPGAERSPPCQGC